MGQRVGRRPSKRGGLLWLLLLIVGAVAVAKWRHMKVPSLEIFDTENDGFIAKEAEKRRVTVRKGGELKAQERTSNDQSNAEGIDVGVLGSKIQDEDVSNGQDDEEYDEEGDYDDVEQKFDESVKSKMAEDDQAIVSRLEKRKSFISDYLEKENKAKEAMKNSIISKFNKIKYKNYGRLRQEEEKVTGEQQEGILKSAKAMLHGDSQAASETYDDDELDDASSELDAGEERPDERQLDEEEEEDDEYEVLDETGTFHECADKLVFEGIQPPPKQPKGKIYKPMMDARSSDTCAEMMHVDKVALLVLAKGKMHHTPTWQAWLASAAGYIPIEYSRGACAKDVEFKKACASLLQKEIDFEDPIEQQVLFNVYVHVPPGAEIELESMWAKRVIKKLVKPEWGSHKIVEATRNLLLRAYRDPRNTRFILVSESDIPLYDPLTLYRQLMHETKSRVDTTDFAHPLDTYRWHWRFLTSIPPVTVKDWRKSGQFFSLIREHVHEILLDVAIFRAFERYCISFWDEEHDYYRVCYSDEHYIATLLKMKDKVEETYKSPNGIVAVDWSQGGEHPKEFYADNLSEFLIYGNLRLMGSCPAPLFTQKYTIATAHKTFVRFSNITGLSKEQCQHIQASKGSVNNYFSPLKFTCPLTARKFKEGTEQRVLRLFLKCKSSLSLLEEGVCEKAKAHFAEINRADFLTKMRDTGTQRKSKKD